MKILQTLGVIGFLSAAAVVFIPQSGFAQTPTAQTPTAPQEELFKVISIRGMVSVIKPSGKFILASGKKLYNDESIEVTANSYISLMHLSGRVLELRTPGKQSVSDLAGRFAKVSSSVSERYANFVFGESLKEKDKDMKKNHQQYMAVTGAVTRSTSRANSAATALQRELASTILLPASSDVFVTQNTFRWRKLPSAKTYVVTISDMFDQTVFQKETSDTTLVVDFGKLTLKNAKMCLLGISAKSAAEEVQAAKIGLRFVQGENFNKIQKEVTQLKAENDGTIIGKVIFGAYYEEHHLYIDAMNSYAEAVAAEPENTDFQTAYNKFLVRIGMLEE